MATTEQPTGRLPDLMQQALAALSADASPESVERLKERLQPFAAELMLEWLTGEKRFESQSQQVEYWLSRFYDEIFTDEQPEATHIYTRFGLSLPRAGYVARMLRARSTATWRRAARDELRKRLGEKRASAEAMQAAKQSSIQEYDIGLSPGAADELRVLYDRVVAEASGASQPKPPKIKPSFGGQRWLSVPADTLLLMLDELDKEDAQK
jgi:hypothetical protein